MHQRVLCSREQRLAFFSQLRKLAEEAIHSKAAAARYATATVVVVLPYIHELGLPL